MKYAVGFFTILVFIISGTLFFQYQVYSDKHSADKGEFFYTQEIEIEYRNGSLDIRQHFKNLPKQTVNINWPSLATSPDCFIESESSCKRLNEDFTKFNESEIVSQSISYIIPLEGGLKNNQLLKDIFATLENGNVSHSTVHITTDNTILGQWVTGLPLVGQQSLTLVNYAMFSGKGPVTELFWENNQLTLQHSSKEVSIFSPNPVPSEVIKELDKMPFLNENHLSIIDGENISKLQGKRILFVNDISLQSLQQNVILYQVRNLYNFDDSPQWVVEMVASFITDLTFENDKAKAIVDTLTARMTNIQLENWKQQLRDLEGEKVTTVVLDETLSNVMNNHTEYFTLNLTSQGEFPFLYNDRREIYVNGYLKDDIDVIFKDGQILYSAKNLLGHLGYQSQEGQNGYYVNNEVRSFRFPPEHKFYVYNQRRYNTVSDPIVNIAGYYFIEESWLQKLFLVDIEKSESTITIKSTTIE